MLDKFRGLPTHALVVHAVVVLLPLAAISAIAIALVPPLRRRYGEVVAALTVIAVAAVPVATHSGSHLFDRKSATFGPANVNEAALMQRHANLGHQLWPWAVTLLAGVLLIVGLPLIHARRAATAEPRQAALTGVGRDGAADRRDGPADLPDAPGRGPAHARARSTGRRASLLGPERPTWVRGLALVALAAVLAGGVGSTIMVVRIGEAGSRAVWSNLPR